MNASEVLRIVDSLHRAKNIDQELVFAAIESALVSAARKHFGEESDIEFNIDRESGEISGRCNETVLDYEDVIGRIGAQTAKQVIIQKVREAERDSLMLEYEQQLGEIVSGTVHRNEGSVTTITLGSVEAILPRSEQIPGESHQPNERIRALVSEVKPQGSRLKVVLSRTHKKLVQRLFEQEIPEIIDGVISINAISREPGYRSKVAVSSIDSKVDSVGACVGVRGNRIKNIIDELAGERIDIVRWDDDPQTMIPNALQPAEVDEVILCQMMGRAIVLVREDQLSLAIGKRGQNVRLASKLCGWDIEIMTQDELEKQIERAVAGFSSLDHVDEDLANQLVGEGYLSYDDLSVIEPEDLMAMGNLTEEQVEVIVEQAEMAAEEIERINQENKRRHGERSTEVRPEQPAAVKDAVAHMVVSETATPGSSEADSNAAASSDTSQSEGSGDSVEAEPSVEQSGLVKQNTDSGVVDTATSPEGTAGDQTEGSEKIEDNENVAEIADSEDAKSSESVPSSES